MPKSNQGASSKPRFPLKVGDRYGKWTVTGVWQRVGHRLLIPSVCECGTEGYINHTHIPKGVSKVCRSCSSRERAIKHGDAITPDKSLQRLYRIWQNMKARCSENSGFETQKNYRLRGITMCSEWEANYSLFKEWALANGYRGDLTIDRRDNNKGYSPNNCRWATRSQQSRNTRRNKILEAFGVTKSMAEWVEDPRCAVVYSTLNDRVRCGWPSGSAITTPPLTSRQRIK